MLLVLALVASVSSARVDPFSDEFLELLQSKETTWKAGRNFAKDVKKEILATIHCVKKFPWIPNLPTKKVDTCSGLVIPESFDAREQWPYCPSINEIRGQGNCGSCWAVSAASVMTDRTCIATEGRAQFRYSSENVLTCSGDCGFGCNGGDEDCALRYWIYEGFVSGGPPGSKEGCQPYSVKECPHHIEGPRPSCEGQMPTLKCKKSCRKGYELSYKDDLEYGQAAYRLPVDVQAIQEEIMANGPVTASFALHSDFFSYKSGVYQHIEGEYHGYHAVRIIGWGEENGTPYWLAANSWNTDWGDDGYFKIIRGRNECEIEEDMAGAIYKPKPLLDDGSSCSR